MPAIDFWIFIAGLGVFLLGINQMESGLKNLAGKSFRTFLRKHTQNPFKAIIVGVLVTSILQSSSVVSLMVLAFVGAGIIPLRNAIAIILGTNLGTTITGWIVAAVGFKFPIDAFALPFLGVGGILVTLMNNRKFFAEIGRFLIGFGALFMGLNYMKNAVEVKEVALTFFESLQLAPHFFFVIGVILTAIIQSSSATMAITLSALYAGVIPLEVAGAIVIGGYVGTTITVFLGALGASHIKKRVAFAHVGFNLLTSVLALIILLPLLTFVKHVLAINDPLYQLVSFHSLFTFIGIIVLFPFIGAYEKLLVKWIQPKAMQSLSPLLESVPVEVIDGAIEAIRKESHDFLERIKKYRFTAFNEEKKTFTQQILEQGKDNVESQYADIQLKEGELITYYLSIQKEVMTPAETKQLDQFVFGIKRMSMAAKYIKTIFHTITELKETEIPALIQLKETVQNQFSLYYAFFEAANFEQDKLLELIDKDYRTNVNFIYQLVQKGILEKSKLTSYLHLNSQIKEYKLNYLEAWSSIN